MQFEQKANEVVEEISWVKNVKVTMSAQPSKPIYAGQLPAGLQKISSIIAVSSCKVGSIISFLLKMESGIAIFGCCRYRSYCEY